MDDDRGTAGADTSGVSDPAAEAVPVYSRPSVHAEGPETEAPDIQTPTIYDVARVAGLSIASVSRVLNGRRNPRPETRDRVLQAVAELGFVPDGAARALSARVKEVVGVVVRRPRWRDDDLFADEDENLQFPDMINRGMEVVAQRPRLRPAHQVGRAGRADPAGGSSRSPARATGSSCTTGCSTSAELARLARQIPVVTLAGVPTPATANVHGDNESGMRELARHLIHDHGYRTIAYLAGHEGSPDSLTRERALAAEAHAAGVTLLRGDAWRGSYQAAESARAIDRLVASGASLPRAIVCANDQSAIGAMWALAQHGISVPGDVAVTGFDDIPVARHLHPKLTSVRQSDPGPGRYRVRDSLLHDRPRGGRPRAMPVAATSRCRRN